MRKIAFLVANDEFPDDDTIPRLRFPQNDAVDLAEILGDKESCGFEPHVHVNEPSYKVLEDLYGISDQLTQDDTLLFYYSGHGMRHKNELFLVSRNTKLSKLMPTSVKASEVLGYLRDSYCKRRILILDCCYSGVIGLQYKAADTESSLDALANDNGTCILTASTSIQLSEEREKDGHGLFTKALIDCLREPRKETINVDDWYLYALGQLRVSGQKPTKCGYVEGHPIEIGNFRKRFARERQLERERLISTARVRLGYYVALGELTEEQVEEAVALLKRDEARLFPRDRRYRDDLIRFSKGEASFLEVFGAGHILRPEPAPEPAEDEVSPPITPPDAPGVNTPLTLYEPPAIDPPVTPPEPTGVDQFVTAPEPMDVDQPVALFKPTDTDHPVTQREHPVPPQHPPVVDQQRVAPSNPTDVERPVTAPEPEAPLGLIRNGGTSERAKGKLQAQAPTFPSATIALLVLVALAITLLGTYFYLQSADQTHLKPQSGETSPSNVRSAEPSPSNVSSPEPTVPTQPAPTTQLAPTLPSIALPAQNQAAPAQQAPQGPVKIDLVPTQNDWTKVCGRDQAANKDICYTTRDFSAQAGQPLVLALAVYDIKGDDTRVIRLLVPSGHMLRPGFRFAIDKGATLEGSFEICFPNGCFAEAKVKSATIDQIKKGSILSVAVKNEHNNEETFEIPVAGFGRAFDGPPIDPKVLEEQQKKLQEKLQKPAEKERTLGRSK